MKIRIFFLLSSLITDIASAQISNSKFTYQPLQGWFFYQLLKQNDDQVEQITDNLIKIPKQPTSKWIKNNLPELLEQALDKPNPENIQKYLVVQAIANLKAHNFSELAQIISINNPLLDNQGELNASNPQIVDAFAAQAQYSLLHKLKNQLVLLWFYHPADPRVELQLESIADLKYSGVQTIAISLGQNQIVSSHFASSIIDQGQADSLGITNSMSFALATATNSKFIAQGILSTPDLLHRIFVFALQNGLITRQQYKASTGIIKLDNSSLQQQINSLLLQINETDKLQNTAKPSL